jgi:hypothetical protein
MLSTFLALALTAPANPYAVEIGGHTTHRALQAALPRAGGWFGAVVPPQIDYRRYDVELRWDFRTGAVAGRATLTLRALPQQNPSTIPLLLDPGISTFTASDATGPLPVDRQGLGGTDYLTLQLPQPIGASVDTVVTLTWSGNLLCGDGIGGAPACSVGTLPFAFMDQGTGIPWLLDPAAGISSDTVLRTWVIQTPKGFDVRAAGELVSQTENATERVSRWQTLKPASLALSSWIVTGTMITQTSAGLPEATVVDAASSQRSLVAGFSRNILPETVRRFGPRSSGEVAQVIVPRSSSFIGTASYAMTLINETYDSLGAELHEEIWAHENIHQHFAVRGYPTDTAVTSLMTEGITTLLELDYTTRHLTGIERDRALGLRLREFGLLLDYSYPKMVSLPLWLADDSLVPRDAESFNVWAYFKGAATLDLLRLYVGEPAFDLALNRYLEACDSGPCSTETFRASLEASSGVSLAPFFSQWMMGTRRPELKIGWTPGVGQVEVELTQSAPGLLPLELWLEQVDGTIRRERWVLTAANERRMISTSLPVRNVRVNPRLEAAIRVRSGLLGDVDFDGEVDGFDVIRCARLLGQTLDTPSARHGVWFKNLDFDPQCDRDGDGKMTSADLAALPFNTLREAR